MLNGKFFRQTLGFNEQQMDAFREINRSFRPLVIDLTFGIDSLKNVMFTELQKPAPDTLKLNSMSEQIGQRHGRLKYETYKFYLSIKKFVFRNKQQNWKGLFNHCLKVMELQVLLTTSE